MKELLLIQTKLNAPKNQYNSFGNYNYRNAEDILEAVKPLLSENKCVLKLTDDIVQIGDRYYVKSIAEIKNSTGETESTTAFAREELTKKGMDGSQITGSSSSYARKYALGGLFAIDDGKDADSINNAKATSTKAVKKVETRQTVGFQKTNFTSNPITKSTTTKSKSTSKLASEAQIKLIRDLGYEKEIKGLSSEGANKIINSLKKKNGTIKKQ